MKTLIVFMLFVSAFYIAQAAVCKLDSDCGTNECCYIKPAFEVVSKRQLILPQPSVSDTGVCEAYHAGGEHCWPLETANGHCGCTAGTRCQWVPGMTVGKRDIYVPPGPGDFKCAYIIV